MKVVTMDKNEIYFRQMFGILRVLGRVMSGNMDTTFGNTLRMSLYNRYVWEVLLKVERDAYDLDAAGDDFDVYHDGSIDRATIERAYYVVWTKGKIKPDGTYYEPIHGLGQILKYLKFGTIADTSFCSTEAFYCKECNSYRIIRQLERFITLNQWSKTLLSLSNHDQAYFLTTLYEANKLWIGELDIFKQANEWLNYNVHKPSKILAGRQKKFLPFDAYYNFLVTDEAAIHTKLRSIDPSLFYSIRDRVGDNFECCNQAFRTQVLERRYGLVPSAIDSICYVISNTPKENESCRIPDLIEAFRTRLTYAHDLCDEDNY